MSTGIKALIVIALFIGSCDSDPAFEVAEITPNIQEAASNVNGLGSLEKSIPNHTLKIISADKQEKKDDNLKLLFLLDNSPSMSDNIDRLKQSVPNLLKNLGSQLDFTGQIATMDLVNGQLEDLGNNRVAPKGTKSGGGADPFANLAMIDQSTDPDVINQKFNEIISDPKRFDNEPGICLAMRYTSSASAKASFKTGDRIHMILMSDEENARTYDTFDHSDYSLTSSKELVCHYGKKTTQQCRDFKYDRYFTFDQYCYSYRKPTTTTVRNHAGQYNKPGTCHKRGFGALDDIVNLSKLYSTKKCVTSKTTHASCEKTVYDTAWSCSAGSHTTSSNWTGKHRCQANGHFLTSNSDISSVKKRCELANNWTCTEYFDGEPFSTEYDRSNALAKIANGYSCAPIASDPGYSWGDLNSGSTVPGMGTCEAYSCEEYTCNSTQNPRTVTGSNIDSSQVSNWDSCTSNPTINNNYDPKKVHSASTGSYGKLTSINTASCPANYNLIDTSSYKINNGSFCDGNPALSSLPAGVSKVAAGTSSSQTNLSFNYNHSNERTIAQTASKLHVRSSDIISHAVNPTTTTTYQEKNNECYTYEKYSPTSTAATTWLPFNFVKTVFNNELDDGTINPPQLQNVTITKVETPNGLYSKRDCEDPVVTESFTKPTPDGFVDLIARENPGVSLNWHSIIYKGPENCLNGVDEGASIGLDYIELSKLTSGIVSDVCALSFKKFIEELTVKILNEIVISYELPKEYKGMEPVLVYNTRLKKALKKQVDYRLVDGFIVFTKSSVKKGDSIHIRY